MQPSAAMRPKRGLALCAAAAMQPSAAMRLTPGPLPVEAPLCGCHMVPCVRQDRYAAGGGAMQPPPLCGRSVG